VSRIGLYCAEFGRFAVSLWPVLISDKKFYLFGDCPKANFILAYY